MAHSDLDKLLDALLSMAETLLRKQGEFLPIGAIMWPDGKIQHVGAKIEGNEYPGAQPLIDLLTETFQAKAAEGKLRAAGICFDGLTIPQGKERKQDVICCGLEHCLGETVNVFRPYTRTELGHVEVEDGFSTNRRPQFFKELPRA